MNVGGGSQPGTGASPHSSGVQVVEALNPQFYDQELRAGRNPWDTVRELRAGLRDLQLRATLEGAGLVRPDAVADDVAELFARTAVEAGLTAFVLLDPLNDLRNLEPVARAIVQAGSRFQGRLCLAAGPPHSVESWRSLAERFVELGATELSLWDPAGQVTPADAGAVLRELDLQVPVAVTLGLPAQMGEIIRCALEDAGLDWTAEAIGRFANEFAQVRADLGYPPLARGAVRLLAGQAALNLRAGERYRQTSDPLRRYLQGLYGRAPGPIEPELRRSVLGHEEPISVRPAELLEPGLPEAEARAKASAGSDAGQVLNWALYPQLMKKVVAPAEPVPSASPDGEGAPAEAAAAGVDGAQADGSAAPAASPPAAAGVAIGGEFDVEVEGEVFRVRVSGAGRPMAVAPAGGAAAAPAAVPTGTAVVAPMQGLIVKINAKPGDEVKLGDVVAVLEAMKMQNDIVATVAGRVSAVSAQPGEVVGPNQAILFIGG